MLNGLRHGNALLSGINFQRFVCRWFKAQVYILLLYRLLRCLRCLLFSHRFYFDCNIRQCGQLRTHIGPKKMHASGLVACIGSYCSGPGFLIGRAVCRARGISHGHKCRFWPHFFYLLAFDPMPIIAANCQRPF